MFLTVTWEIHYKTSGTVCVSLRLQGNTETHRFVSWPANVHLHFAGWLLFLPWPLNIRLAILSRKQTPAYSLCTSLTNTISMKTNEKVVKVKYSSLIFIASPSASSHVHSIIRWGSCLQAIAQGMEPHHQSDPYSRQLRRRGSPQ